MLATNLVACLYVYIALLRTKSLYRGSFELPVSANETKDPWVPLAVNVVAVLYGTGWSMGQQSEAR